MSGNRSFYSDPKFPLVDPHHGRFLGVHHAHAHGISDDALVIAALLHHHTDRWRVRHHIAQHVDHLGRELLAAQQTDVSAFLRSNGNAVIQQVGVQAGHDVVGDAWEKVEAQRNSGRWK